MGGNGRLVTVGGNGRTMVVRSQRPPPRATTAVPLMRIMFPGRNPVGRKRPAGGATAGRGSPRKVTARCSVVAWRARPSHS